MRPVNPGGDRVLDIHLHLGAHKTATTYLQDVLEGFQPESALAGVFYVPLIDMRMKITSAVDLVPPAGRFSVGAFFVVRRLRQKRRAYLNDLGRLDHRVLLSDENLIGHPRDSLRGDFYPHAEEKLRDLALALPGPVRRIYFSIRRYTTFLTSLFVEALKSRTDATADTLTAAYAAPHAHWTDLLDRIGAIFPAAEIIVWRMEDFPALRAEILSMMSGLPREVTAAAPDRVVRPGLSATGMQAVLDGFQAVPGSVLREVAMLEAEARYPRRSQAESYDPWSVPVAAAWAALYDEEWRALKSHPRFTTLQG